MWEYKKILAETRAWAWQPFTGPGLAAFARAPLGWIALLQLAVGLISGIIVAWAFAVAWGPAIETAADQLPGVVEFENGRFFWPGTNAVRLAETPFVSLVADPIGKGLPGQIADVQFEFGEREITVRGLLGAASFPIPPPFHSAFDRLRATTGWAAWSWVVYLGITLGCLAALFFSWWLLATLYSVPAWTVGQIFGKDLTWTGAWRLSAAALLPGALTMSAFIALYAMQWIRLPGLLLGMPIHLVVGWVWLLWGIGWVKPEEDLISKKINPFEPRRDSEGDDDRARRVPRRKRRRENPFGS